MVFYSVVIPKKEETIHRSVFSVISQFLIVLWHYHSQSYYYQISHVFWLNRDAYLFLLASTLKIEITCTPLTVYNERPVPLRKIHMTIHHQGGGGALYIGLSRSSIIGTRKGCLQLIDCWLLLCECSRRNHHGWRSASRDIVQLMRHLGKGE